MSADREPSSLDWLHRTHSAEEFRAQLQGLLEAAAKLGLGPQEIVDRVEQALSAQPDAAPAHNEMHRRKPE